MSSDDRRLRILLPVSIVAAVLLAIRFAASTVLVATDLPSETLATIDRILTAYEVLLPFAFLAAIGYFALAWTESRARWVALLAVLVHVAALVLWLLTLDPATGPAAALPFAVLAMASVGFAASLAHGFAGRRWPRGWQRIAFVSLVVLIPVVFGLRLAASLGAGTAPDPGGVLRGNWFLVNAPTILLEVLVIGTWLNAILDVPPAALRARWPALFPLVFVPLAAFAFEARPLSGYILSALITWGSNLALFVPAIVSLSLASAAAACYASVLLLADRRGRRPAWRAVAFGSLSIFLAGFYPSMASVTGLSLGLLLTALALAAYRCPTEAGRADASPADRAASEPGP